MSRVHVEICIDSFAGAIAAREGGADRVELCGSLVEGGITPSAGLLRQVCEAAGIDVMAMIRPRGGDFCYDPHELETMQRDIDEAKQAGARGVVFGALRTDGSVDRDLVSALVERARPLEVTFHRAFDMVREPFEALDALIDLGIERVLTSGQAPSAPEGARRLRELVERADGRIVVMPGCGVRPTNAREVLEATGAREIHLSARGSVDSPMEFRSDSCSMASGQPPGEYERAVTDPEVVRRTVEALSASG